MLQIQGNFLFFYLQSQYWHLRNFSHGSVQSGLNIEILRNYSISLPPYDEQEQIYDFLKTQVIQFDVLDTTITSTIFNYFFDDREYNYDVEITTLNSLTLTDGISRLRFTHYEP